MAKKITKSSKSAAPAVSEKAAAVPTSTAIRNSAVPPKSVAAKKLAPTYDQIALHAFVIWQSGQGGDQEDNWLRAERELRGL